MKPWKAIVAALVLFLAGFASGTIAAQLYRLKRPRPPIPTAPTGHALQGLGQRIDVLRRLTARLNLTPAQRENIDRAIRESQERLRLMWQPIEPAAKEEVRQLRRRIAAELRPEQRERFESLLRERPPRTSADPLPTRRRSDNPNRTPVPTAQPASPVPPGDPREADPERR